MTTHRTDWAPLFDATRELCVRELDALAVYIHGSIVMGCASENSDVDVLVVVRRRDPVALESFHRGLLSLDQKAPGKGFELSVITEDAARDFTHPMPYVYHFSRTAQQIGVFEDERRDPDLAAHVETTRARGLTLAGPPPQELLAEPPYESVLDSVRADARQCAHNILSDPQVGPTPVPTYSVLNLARTIAYSRQRRILSKAEGAHWALENLPPAFHPLLSRALEEYTDPGRREAAGEELLAFAVFASAALEL